MSHLIVNSQRYATEGEAWSALRIRHESWLAKHGPDGYAGWETVGAWEPPTEPARGRFSYKCLWNSHGECSGRGRGDRAAPLYCCSCPCHSKGATA